MYLYTYTRRVDIFMKKNNYINYYIIYIIIIIIHLTKTFYHFLSISRNWYILYNLNSSYNKILQNCCLTWQCIFKNEFHECTNNYKYAKQSKRVESSCKREIFRFFKRKKKNRFISILCVHRLKRSRFLNDIILFKPLNFPPPPLDIFTFSNFLLSEERYYLSYLPGQKSLFFIDLNSPL